jgi:hypothetical protein
MQGTIRCIPRPPTSLLGHFLLRTDYIRAVRSVDLEEEDLGITGRVPQTPYQPMNSSPCRIIFNVTARQSGVAAFLSNNVQA